MTKTKMLTFKERIESHVQAIFLEVPAPRSKNSAVARLHEVFIWQTICKIAMSRLKQAWKTVQPTYMPEDEELRDKGEGDYILVECGPYSGTVNISQGRQMFSKDLFIDAVARNYKIDRAKLALLAETCYTRSKRSVEKRVVEVA